MTLLEIMKFVGTVFKILCVCNCLKIEIEMRKAKQVSEDSFYSLGNRQIQPILTFFFLVQKENKFGLKVYDS